jgi:hypothetical protein
MRLPGPTVVAAIAVGVAVVIVVAAFAFPGPGSNRGFSNTFDFSQNLPTGSMVSNGQLDCGSNVTESLTVPNYAKVYIFLEMNQSGASANVWMVGPGLGDTGFVAVGFGGVTHEELGIGLGGQLQFFLQGCGPGPSVPLGFWGYITSGSVGT